ncbi:hypothetical protein [Botrimarina sp.]|uniref:hypothetical protein n=1 Tax=Botrimarina sp. TaxID=2795802 RepID=UPI0032EC6679
MDQIKVALAWLKKHHFWVLAVIVVGAATGVWYSGSASVASATDSAKSTIQSQFQQVKTHSTASFKPNEGINSQQREEVRKQAENVLAEWNKLYEIQKETTLIWPEELGPRFINAVQGDRFGDPISSTNRNAYQNYISEAFPSLVAKVDARLIPADGARGPRPGMGGGEFGPGGPVDGEPEDTHLVEWLDQLDLRKRLDLDTTPSALTVWVLQEDLWVYTSVLGAIADTNEATGATRRERAAVQTIVELKVGQAAGPSNAEEQRIVAPEKEKVASGGGGFGGEFGGGEYGGYGGGEFGGGEFGGGEYGGGEFGGGMGGEYGGGGYGGGEFGGGAAVPEGADPETALLAGRYLDEAGAPITTVTPGDYSFGREFKRLPVRMVLEMDTRWLPTLMWELANAPLQVEIEQVRFNPGEGARAGRSFNASAGAAAAFERRPTVGTVILHGIVYIFNQPDPAVAQLDAAE